MYIGAILGVSTQTDYFYEMSYQDISRIFSTRMVFAGYDRRDRAGRASVRIDEVRSSHAQNQFLLQNRKQRCLVKH
jgi:hypothetical protein